MDPQDLWLQKSEAIGVGRNSWGVLPSASKKCATPFQGNKRAPELLGENQAFHVTKKQRFSWFFWPRFNYLLCNEIHSFFHVRDTSLWRLGPGVVGGQYWFRRAGKSWKKCCVLINLARQDSHEYFTTCPNANRHLGFRDAMVKFLHLQLLRIDQVDP